MSCIIFCYGFLFTIEVDLSYDMRFLIIEALLYNNIKFHIFRSLLYKHNHVCNKCFLSLPPTYRLFDRLVTCCLPVSASVGE